MDTHLGLRADRTFVLALHGWGSALRRAPAFLRWRTGMHDSPPSPREEPPLAALLHAAARGDARAFEQFYGATCRQALAVVRRIAGAALAEDVLSDCYFQAWREAGRFDATRGDAVAWLLTMARSRALDRVRKETLRHGGLTGAPEFDPASCEDAGVPGPEALLQGVQERSNLHAALAALSPNERWVLGLAYYHDFTQAEIAGITQMPLGTVKSLMTRAQHKLREALQNRAH